MTKKQDSLEELIPTKTDNVIIHGYLNLNRKQIKDWHKAQQRELIEKIEEFIETWKEGKCKDCFNRVPNWNCKQHAYLDLLQFLNKLK